MIYREVGAVGKLANVTDMGNYVCTSIIECLALDGTYYIACLRDHTAQATENRALLFGLEIVEPGRCGAGYRSYLQVDLQIRI
jgi:hypothetical protein